MHMIARAVIIDNGKLLMCKNKAGFYSLPGGHVDEGEIAAGAVERELKEELGLVFTVKKLLGDFEYSFETQGKVKCHSQEHNFVFEMRPVLTVSSAVVPKSLESHLEFAWVSLFDFQGMDIRPEKLKELIPLWQLPDQYPKFFY